MNMNKITREQISALADGELTDVQIEATLKVLRQTEEMATWGAYHQIGDILRSQEMAKPLSSSFAARMAARLEAEAPLSAETTAIPLPRPVSGRSWGAVIRRFLLPGLTGGAVAAIALLMAPQFLVQTDDRPVAASVDNLPVVSMDQGGVIPAAAPEAAAVVPATSQQGLTTQEDNLVRDPRLDQYLMAHQRFSPSVYSSAQFVRSVTFAADTEK